MKRRTWKRGRGAVRKIGPAWYIRYSYGGRRREEKTKAQSKTEAEAALRQILTQIDAGMYDPDAKRTRVSALFREMQRDYGINGRNAKDLDKRWKHLAQAFGSDLAYHVTTPRISAYIESRLTAGAARATVQREIACLRRMFRLGIQAGKVMRLPHFPAIQIDNVRKGFFERAEFERLRAELPLYLQPVVTVAYWTGWRRGELLGLEWRQVDLEAGTVRLDPGTTKNKQGRLVYLPPEALDVLRKWRAATTSIEREQSRIITRVFHRAGKPIGGYFKAWRSAARRAGLEGRTLHDFRRTAARNYVRSGVPERVAMSILGHKTRSIFDRYNITNENDLREAAVRVAALRNGEKMGKVAPITQVRKDRGAR